MSLLDEVVSDDLAQSIRNVGNAAMDTLEEGVSRGATRVRASAKTRKSAQTRERIMIAAAQLMVERGNTDFQMSEVSERCHMSKGALYYYFSDKDALVQAVFDREFDDLIDDIEVAVTGATSAEASMVTIVHTIAKDLSPSSPLALALTHEVIDVTGELLPGVSTRIARIVAIFETQVERAKVEGLVEASADSHLVAFSIIGSTVLLVLEQQSISGFDVTDEAFAECIITLMLTGVGTQRARDAHVVKGDEDVCAPESDVSVSEPATADSVS